MTARPSRSSIWYFGGAILLMSSTACEIGLTTLVPTGSQDRPSNKPSLSDTALLDSDTADTGWTGQETEEDPNNEPAEQDPEESCDRVGFNAIMQQATQDNSDKTKPLFVYQAREQDTVPFTEFQIASFQGSPYNGPNKPGTYSLDGSNYSDCALCVLIVKGCNESYSCNTIYFADAGELQVSQMNSNGAAFLAELTNAVFREVRLDPETYESTPIQGGETWCIDSLSIAAGVRVVN